MPRNLMHRLLLSFALCLSLTRLTAAAEIPPVDDPETQVRDYVDALVRQDFDGVMKVACGAGNPTDCEFGKGLRDALISLKGRKLTSTGNVLDLSFPEAVREIYFSMRADDYTPVYLRFTYRMSDTGWRHAASRFATGSSDALFPASLLEGSLVGLTGTNRTGPATVVDETSEKTMAGIAKRDYESVTTAIQRAIPDISERTKSSIDNFVDTMKPYNLSHIRKIIDREMDGFRQQFYYAVVSDKDAMFIRLTYAKANGQWWLYNIQSATDNRGIIPADILKDTFAILPAL